MDSIMAFQTLCRKMRPRNRTRRFSRAAFNAPQKPWKQNDIRALFRFNRGARKYRVSSVTIETTQLVTMDDLWPGLSRRGSSRDGSGADLRPYLWPRPHLSHQRTPSYNIAVPHREFPGAARKCRGSFHGRDAGGPLSGQDLRLWLGLHRRHSGVVDQIPVISGSGQRSYGDVYQVGRAQMGMVSLVAYSGIYHLRGPVTLW